MVLRVDERPRERMEVGGGGGEHAYHTVVLFYVCLLGMTQLTRKHPIALG